MENQGNQLGNYRPLPHGRLSRRQIPQNVERLPYFQLQQLCAAGHLPPILPIQMMQQNLQVQQQNYSSASVYRMSQPRNTNGMGATPPPNRQTQQNQSSSYEMNQSSPTGGVRMAYNTPYGMNNAQGAAIPSSNMTGTTQTMRLTMESQGNQGGNVRSLPYGRLVRQPMPQKRTSHLQLQQLCASRQMLSTLPFQFVQQNSPVQQQVQQQNYSPALVYRMSQPRNTNGMVATPPPNHQTQQNQPSNYEMNQSSPTGGIRMAYNTPYGMNNGQVAAIPASNMTGTPQTMFLTMESQGGNVRSLPHGRLIRRPIPQKRTSHAQLQQLYASRQSLPTSPFQFVQQNAPVQQQVQQPNYSSFSVYRMSQPRNTNGMVATPQIRQSQPLNYEMTESTPVRNVRMVYNTPNAMNNEFRSSISPSDVSFGSFTIPSTNSNIYSSQQYSPFDPTNYESHSNSIEVIDLDYDDPPETKLQNEKIEEPQIIDEQPKQIIKSADEVENVEDEIDSDPSIKHAKLFADYADEFLREMLTSKPCVPRNIPTFSPTKKVNWQKTEDEIIEISKKRGYSTRMVTDNIMEMKVEITKSNRPLFITFSFKMGDINCVTVGNFMNLWEVDPFTSKRCQPFTSQFMDYLYQCKHRNYETFQTVEFLLDLFDEINHEVCIGKEPAICLGCNDNVFDTPRIITGPCLGKLHLSHHECLGKQANN